VIRFEQHEIGLEATVQRLEVVRRRIPQEFFQALRDALSRFDEPAAQAVLDRFVSSLSLSSVLRDVVIPYLNDLGRRWERGQASIAEEHFASQLIRDRLLGLARDWDQGRGPRALLACPADERHDIALICFGVVLSRSGWRITFLGPDTPVTALADAVATLTPDLIVLSATVEERFTSIAAHLSALTSGANLVLAGPGASAAAAHATGAGLLEDEPVAAAVTTAARLPVPGPPHPTSHARNTRA